MDSPVYKAMKDMHASHSNIGNIPMSTDDSGYITVTPSSADLTSLSGGNSRRLPLSRMLNSSNDFRRNNQVSISLSTPRGKCTYRNSRHIESRPKQLREHFSINTQYLDSIVKHVPLPSRITSDELTISVKNKLDSETVSFACGNANKTPTLQSTLHGEEGMECSNNNFINTKKNISASGNDKFSTNVLPVIVVNDAGIPQPRPVFEFKGNTEESLLPVNGHVTLSSGSNVLLPSCSSISKVNVSTGAIPKFYSHKIAVSPMTETISNSNAHQKCNYHEKFGNSLQLTPRKQESLASPIFKRDLHKSVKKINFNSQKIGTPEKNSLLYNNLKPVTLPKKLKSPEKLRGSLISSTKCRKKLFYNINKENSEKTVNYSGQKYIDFLKMLGEQQNHVPALKSIFNYLSCKDLMKICCVSKIWNKVCCNDAQAASRKRVYADDIEMHKENIHIHLQISPNKRSKLEIDPIQYSIKGHKMLMEIDNNNRNRMIQKLPIQRSPPVSPGKRKFKTHINTAMKNPESSLRRCVRCDKPATVKSQWAICSGLDCGFHFCTRCHTEYSHGYACCQRPIQSASPSKDSQSKLYIGTRKSRKNLKRL